MVTLKTGDKSRLTNVLKANLYWIDSNKKCRLLYPGALHWECRILLPGDGDYSGQATFCKHIKSKMYPESFQQENGRLLYPEALH